MGQWTKNCSVNICGRAMSNKQSIKNFDTISTVNKCERIGLYYRMLYNTLIVIQIPNTFLCPRGGAEAVLSQWRLLTFVNDKSHRLRVADL